MESVGVSAQFADECCLSQAKLQRLFKTSPQGWVDHASRRHVDRDDDVSVAAGVVIICGSKYGWAGASVGHSPSQVTGSHTFSGNGLGVLLTRLMVDLAVESCSVLEVV